MPTPTVINLNDSTPMAPPGRRNAHVQADTNNPRNVSFNYVSLGGAIQHTASYTAVAADDGVLLTFNGAAALTLTLPATPPDANYAVLVQNIGAGLLTLNGNGLLIDGKSAGLPIAQNRGVYVTTDGINYFTERGLSGFGGSQMLTASYTGQTSDDKLLLSFNSAAAIAYTLPATPPSTTWAIFLQNIGAGTLTVARNGLLIDGQAANLTVAQGEGIYLTTDGTNYFTEGYLGSRAVRPYHIVFQYVGKPGAGVKVGIFTMPSDFDPTGISFPNISTYSRGSCGTNPSATAIYTINKISGGITSGFCTISVSTAGVFSFTGGGTLVGGDRLEAIAPNPADATLADVAVTISGRR